MKKFKNFEDSAPFLLVLKKSVQDNSSAIIRVTFGNQIPHWVNEPWKHPALRRKKQCAKIKTLKSHRPYRMWKKNQSALLPWVKHDQPSTEKQNLAKPASNAMFASWVKTMNTAGGNGTKMPKPFLSETTCAVAVLPLSSSFVNRETWRKVFTEARRECHIVVSDTTHNPGKYQRTSSNLNKAV